MSKKNSRSKRASQLQFDRKREKEQQERLRKAQTTAAAPKPGKRKAIRLRKNMVVRGIKIKDSDSKKQALALLKAEQASKMDVDGERIVLARGSKATKAARAVGVKGGVQKKQGGGKAVAMMLD